MIAKQGQSREAMHNSQQPRSPRLLRVHCHRANVHSGQWCAVTYYQPVARPDCREHCWLRIMCLPVPKPGGSRRMCDKYMNLRPATTSNNCESRRAWERKCVAAHGLLGRACRYKIHGRDRPASHPDRAPNVMSRASAAPSVSLVATSELTENLRTFPPERSRHCAREARTCAELAWLNMWGAWSRGGLRNQ